MFAKEIGLACTAVRRYRWVASPWPEKPWRAVMSFTIHKILARFPDPEEPFTGVTEPLWTAHGEGSEGEAANHGSGGRDGIAAPLSIADSIPFLVWNPLPRVESADADHGDVQLRGELLGLGEVEALAASSETFCDAFDEGGAVSIAIRRRRVIDIPEPSVSCPRMEPL
jgi:hypothetical protein